MTCKCSRYQLIGCWRANCPGCSRACGCINDVTVQYIKTPAATVKPGVIESFRTSVVDMTATEVTANTERGIDAMTASLSGVKESSANPKTTGGAAAGVKFDTDKTDITLLQDFSRALHEVARVGDYGQSKYTRGGFLPLADGVRRYTRAMLDHWFKEDTEGKYDQDPHPLMQDPKWKNKIRHDAQVAWNALARLELRLREEEKLK